MRSATRRLSLRDEIQDKELSSDLEDLRQDLRDFIHPHVKEYAAIIGVPDSRREFEEGLIDAFQWCILTVVIPRKRHSQVRNELLRVSKEARAAQQSLHRLRGALETLSPPYTEPLERLMVMPAKIALSTTAKHGPYALSSVADAAEFQASVLKGKDKGGVPKKLAFRTLVLYLGRAFANATKHEAKVTWNEHEGRFEGKFFHFVEAVLPLVIRFIEGRPFPYPKSPQSRGKYIYELTRARTAKL